LEEIHTQAKTNDVAHLIILITVALLRQRVHRIFKKVHERKGIKTDPQPLDPTPRRSAKQQSRTNRQTACPTGAVRQ